MKTKNDMECTFLEAKRTFTHQVQKLQTRLDNAHETQRGLGSLRQHDGEGTANHKQALDTYDDRLEALEAKFAQANKLLSSEREDLHGASAANAIEGDVRSRKQDAVKIKRLENELAQTQAIMRMQAESMERLTVKSKIKKCGYRASSNHSKDVSEDQFKAMHARLAQYRKELDSQREDLHTVDQKLDSANARVKTAEDEFILRRPVIDKGEKLETEPIRTRAVARLQAESMERLTTSSSKKRGGSKLESSQSSKSARMD